MKEMEIKTGRRTEDIRAELLALEKDHYISWEDKSHLRDIVIIEGWECGQSRPMPTGNDERYFREY
ncbi:hypothetical protein [Paenibacillus sp. NPDC055715]